MVLNKVFRKFPFIAQHDAMDCGPACLAMISSYYGKDYGLQYMRDCSYLTREGVSLVGLTEAAVTIGMKSVSLRITAILGNSRTISSSAILECLSFRSALCNHKGKALTKIHLPYR